MLESASERDSVCVVFVPRFVPLVARSESRRDKDWVVIVQSFVPLMSESASGGHTNNVVFSRIPVLSIAMNNSMQDQGYVVPVLWYVVLIFIVRRTKR